MEDNKRKFSIIARTQSFQYAFAGLKTLLKEEHNSWVQLFAAVLAITLGFVFRISATEWLFIIVAIGFVIASELFNSAIEALADFATLEKHPQIKKVKDLAAGAVLIASLTALTTGLLIFIPKFIHL